MDDPELEVALTRLFDEAGAEDRRDLDRLFVLLDAEAIDVDVTRGAVDDRAGDLVAVRSAGTVEDHQVVVRGGWTDVVLDVAEAGPAVVDVRGTVLGSAGNVSAGVCSVQLLRDGAEVAIAVTDEFGDFALLGVDAGRYELVVASARGELTTDLELS